MKKIAFTLFLALLMLSLFAQKLTVIDYFEKLPPEIIDDYKIENAEGEWISKSNAGYEIFPTVDIINGYIEIMQNANNPLVTDDPEVATVKKVALNELPKDLFKTGGTGGGTTKLQVVLYRKKDGSALIAISKYTNDGGMYIESRINFMEYKNEEWIDVTYDIQPSITCNNFVNQGFDMPDFPEAFHETFGIVYNLPQYGTTIEISLIVGGLTLICDGTMESLPADKKLVCDFIDNTKKTPIKLYWDKPNRKFYLK